MDTNIKRLASAALGVGLASVAAYLNVNGQGAWFLWLGVLICFIDVTGD
jgi:uncharacterized membrane protein YgaE (UPF0421/DUF939 family)